MVVLVILAGCLWRTSWESNLTKSQLGQLKGIITRFVVLEQVLQVRLRVALRVSLASAGIALIPAKIRPELRLGVQNPVPLCSNRRPLQERLDDVAVVPFSHGTSAFKMLRDMVTSFLPVTAEVCAKATTPASAGLKLLPCSFVVLVSLAILATMTRFMVIDEVFLKEVAGAAEAA